MPDTVLRCEQAIFTSIRTPTGEGYRIIAAGRGLRADEKQVITRFSPSHDAICPPAEYVPDSTAVVPAATFYPLPSGRLCVALSCYAGAEHTGRGGQRVYTHNLVFDREDFPLCGYNPFVVLRAMVDAQLTSPQLKPPDVLPELEVPIAGPATVAAFGEAATAGDLWGALNPNWRGYVLQTLLGEGHLVVNLKGGWLAVAEALLMGLPGPMRAEASFAAGLRFSVGRRHRLSILWGEQNVTKSRAGGKNTEYVDPETTDTPPRSPSAGRVCVTVGTEWLSFVERHWRNGDTVALAQRTSRDFSDVGPAGRERIGRLYNQIDTIPQTESAALLAAVRDQLNRPENGAETDIAAELIVKVQSTLLYRFRTVPWNEVKRYWHVILEIATQSDDGRTFAGPLIDEALRVGMARHPTEAAEAALDLARIALRALPKRDTAMTGAQTACIERVLSRLAEWADHAADAELETLLRLCNQWEVVRPRCPILERIRRRCGVPQSLR